MIFKVGMLVFCAVGNTNQFDSTPMRVEYIREYQLVVKFVGGNNSRWILHNDLCVPAKDLSAEGTTK